MSSYNQEFESALQAALTRGNAMAKQNQHEYVTLEHFLWGAIGLPIVINMFEGMNVNVESMRLELENKIFELHSKTKSNADPVHTVALNRVLHRAIEHSIQSSSKSVSLLTVMINLLDEEESHASYFMQNANITKQKIQMYASHGQDGLDSLRGNRRSQSMSVQKDDDRDEETSNALSKFATNLNERARSGRIDSLIGRDTELRRTAQILSRRRKNNPLLVGEPGVGKTAIAEGLAKMIVEGKAPDALKSKRIYSVEVGTLLAGTKYRGDFEKRMKAIVDAAKNDPDVILFVDEIHTIIGAGGASGGAIDASNLIKPALSSGDLRMIGATTYQEFRNIFEKESALNRRFQKIDVREPTAEETYEILRGASRQLESHHGVSFTKEALKAAVDLSVRFITDRRLPDKALDLLDDAAADERLKEESKRRKVIDVKQIEKAVSDTARVPVGNVSKDEKAGLIELESDLSGKIFGQENAISSLVTSVQIAKAGMNDPKKPLGSFLFAGPTGVGKTEVTKVLSETLSMPLLRFDMSEYMEPHSVARLIGSPPGYVGSEKSGLLTDAVFKEPHSVLLLDEVEKAHPDVLNVLLQILDHGSLTDNSGRTIDFRNTIVVLTTNVGATLAARPRMGFTQADNSTDANLALEKSFSPELRNRIDSIIQFKPLDEKAIEKVVEKNIKILNEQLMEKNVTLIVGENARKALAREGYVPAMGARPMARLISEKLKKPLAQKMLFGELQNGGTANVEVDDNGNWVWSETPMITVVHGSSSKKENTTTRRRIKSP